MKHLLIIFTLLLTSVSWSENVDYDDLVTRDEIYYEKFSNKPFTGKTTGRIKGKIIDGKREGEILYFYDKFVYLSSLSEQMFWLYYLHIKVY